VLERKFFFFCPAVRCCDLVYVGDKILSVRIERVKYVYDYDGMRISGHIYTVRYDVVLQHTFFLI
jgi:hypothetical protein